MPYSIRKQGCKQSDGDSGSYTLSYTDNKGKKHRACHTSRKKARGQIAAIEGPRESAGSIDGDEAVLRETIRYLLESENIKAPTELAPAISETEPKESQVLAWEDIKAQGEAKGLDVDVSQIDKIKGKGPEAGNQYGESAVVAALNIMGGSGTATRASEKTGYDLKIGSTDRVVGIPNKVTLTLKQTSLVLDPGVYEVKTRSGDALSRLGPSKAISVASQNPLAALTRLGRAYASIIVGGGFVLKAEDAEDSDLTVMTAYKKLKDFFEGYFSGAKRNKRYHNMAALMLPAGAINELKEGKFYEGLKAIEDAFRGANLSDEKGSEGTVTVVSDASGPTGELDQYEFDSETWDLQVQPYLTSKIKNSPTSPPDKEAIRDLRKALREMWGVIRDTSAEIQKLGDKKYWDQLAEKTQAGSVMGIFGVDKDGMRLYKFPDLTVKSITEQGRLELVPISELAPVSESVSSSRMIRDLIREMIRHAK